MGLLNRLFSVIGVASDGSMVFPKTSSICIKRDLDDPKCTWKDLIGDVKPKTIGVGAPTLDTIRGAVRAFRYSNGDDGDIIFHIPHDYVPGTDLYLHPHWTHNGTNISGSFVITYNFTYADRTSTAPADIFIADRVLTHTINTGMNITDTPQYAHRVDEIQITSAGGSASTLDKATIQTDGILILHYDVDTIPTITGGSGEPFILTLDIHYQSTNLGTPNKDPDFYS
jgi:hypothetical protein